VLTDQIAIPGAELRSILAETMPGDSLLPELDLARADIAAFRQRPPARAMWEASEAFLRYTDIQAIPPQTYTQYRWWRRTGQPYTAKGVAKWTKFSVAVLRLLLGDDDMLDVVHDYIWSICEETTWVWASHEPMEIDLGVAGAAVALAQVVAALKDKLAGEVCQRVRDEIERRLFAPYLERHDTYWWYRGHNNWNGVCNGSIGSTFLLLEEDQSRLARALAVVLAGLDAYIHTAFEEDGASTEGVGYWQYGLSKLVGFSEFLRQRTRGRIDLLSGQRMKAIARYPLRVMLSPGYYASFADSRERCSLVPGLVNRLAERTGITELAGVLAEPREPLSLPPSQDVLTRLRQLHIDSLDVTMRALLWWDGQRPAAEPVLTDDYLSKLGAARLVAQTSAGLPVVVAFKAGHNAENHNHNDVGTFAVHVDGETLLCDPGPGLYDNRYFTPARYENMFASSFGHSVPRLGVHTQPPGREFEGQILSYEPEAGSKRVVAEIGRAYAVPGLESIRRTITLAAQGTDSGTVWLQDDFTFACEGPQVEEAFVTWLETDASGPVAVVHGEKHAVELMIEEPAGAAFAVQRLEKECLANKAPGVLKRLTFTLEPAKHTHARVRIRVKSD